MLVMARWIAAVMVLAVSACGPAQAQSVLRWKLQPNQTLRYEISQDVVSSFQFNNQPIKLSVAQLLDVRWQVTDVDAEGAASFAQTFDRIRVKVNQLNQPEVVYDSASKEEPVGQAKVLAAFYSLLVGKSTVVKINAKGEVQQFDFPVEVLEKLKQIPGGSQMGALLSEQGMKQMLDVMALPEEGVMKGSTWQRHTELNPPGVGKEEIDTSYTYAGNETKDGRELEKLDLTATIKFTPNEKQQTAVEVQEQDTKGVIYFDNAAGYLVESNATGNMNLQVSLQGNRHSQNMQITSRMTLVPDEQK